MKQPVRDKHFRAFRLNFVCFPLFHHMERDRLLYSTHWFYIKFTDQQVDDKEAPFQFSFLSEKLDKSFQWSKTTKETNEIVLMCLPNGCKLYIS